MTGQTAPGGDFPVTGRTLARKRWPTPEKRCCSHRSAADSESNLKMRAVHELTHAYQKAASGGVMPAWLMEGGAVYMECVMAQRAGLGITLTLPTGY